LFRNSTAGTIGSCYRITARRRSPRGRRSS
jgi:hypothetical protein